MEITREDVLRCARLTDLSLEEEEIEALRRDMEQLLSQAQKLDALELGQVDASSHGHELPLPRREDLPGPTFSREQALANAPAQEKGHFLVPKVL